jgi:peptidylprolyl isomerase
MTQAKSGDTVRVHYTGTLDDGTTFDSSQGREPLEFTLGEGAVISGFEEVVTGMAVGENKQATIPADQAYGQHDPAMVHEVPRAEIPAEVTLEVGGQLQATDGAGRTHLLTVADLSEETVTLDANHPLAGKDLNFDIELVEIV